MKKLISKMVNMCGYEIRKIQTNYESTSPYTSLLEGKNIIDVENLSSIAQSIPGMIELYSGKNLYLLCYFQELQGDVVEVGSWLGRSSVFLAQAVKESNNGKFYAIDHFQGNKGKENLYSKHVPLADIKQQYIRNLEKVNLMDWVNLLDMPSADAVKCIKSNQIRLLFLDGDHTREGVQKDIELFMPMLNSGSIIVFDDFSSNFPGVIDAVKDLFVTKNIKKSFAYKNTLVVLM